MATENLFSKYSFDILKKYLFFAVLASLSQPIHSKENPYPLLEVKIYYSALCPDSVNFIKNQLEHAMIHKKLLKYADLKFIPYGKASISADATSGKEIAICQHGPEECDLTALHACIVENYNKSQQIHLIPCLMGGQTPVETCFNHHNIDSSKALTCRSSRTIEEILRKYKADTDTIGITFVPSIALGGTFDRDAQDEFLHNFTHNFCEKYRETYDFHIDVCKAK